MAAVAGGGMAKGLMGMAPPGDARLARLLPPSVVKGLPTAAMIKRKIKKKKMNLQIRERHEGVVNGDSSTGM